MKNALIILPSEIKRAQSLLNEIWSDYNHHIYADNLCLKPQDDNFIIIGDMDTYKEKSNSIIKIDNQDTTDSEKAILWCKEHNIEEVTILNTIRSRSDHFFYNISLLKKHNEDFKQIKLISDEEEIFIINKSIEITGNRNKLISFFPLFGDAKVKTEGLKYDFDTTMNFENFNSVSNEFEKEEVKIELLSGSLVCIKER